MNKIEFKNNYIYKRPKETKMSDVSDEDEEEEVTKVAQDDDDEDEEDEEADEDEDEEDEDEDEKATTKKKSRSTVNTAEVNRLMSQFSATGNLFGPAPIQLNIVGTAAAPAQTPSVTDIKQPVPISLNLATPVLSFAPLSVALPPITPSVTSGATQVPSLSLLPPERPITERIMLSMGQKEPVGPQSLETLLVQKPDEKLEVFNNRVQLTKILAAIPSMPMSPFTAVTIGKMFIDSATLGVKYNADVTNMLNTISRTIEQAAGTASASNATTPVLTTTVIPK